MTRQTPDGMVKPEDMLCFDVYTLQQALSRVYKPLLEPLNLTYPQYLVMSVLWDAAPLPVGRIGARLGLETSTVTPLLKRLEQQGLVERRRSTEDERRVDVDLTKAGTDLAAKAADVPQCVESATGLSQEGIARLRGDLQSVRENLLQSVRPD